MANAPHEIYSVLRSEFNRLRATNPRFSLRAFARRIGIDPGSLSQIINGERSVSTKKAREIALRLNLTENTLNRLMSNISKAECWDELKKPVQSSRDLLESDHYFVMSDWVYYSILSLLETKDFTEDPHWIGSRLEVSPQRVEVALKRLEKMGFVERDEQGKLIQKCPHLDTTNDVYHPALLRRHVENLEYSQQAIVEVESLLREFTFITIAADQSKIPKAKAMIREFRDRLCEFMETGEKTEVYELQIQLVPRTKIKLKEDALPAVSH